MLSIPKCSLARSFASICLASPPSARSLSASHSQARSHPPLKIATFVAPWPSSLFRSAAYPNSWIRHTPGRWRRVTRSDSPVSATVSRTSPPLLADSARSARAAKSLVEPSSAPHAWAPSWVSSRASSGCADDKTPTYLILLIHEGFRIK